MARCPSSPLFAPPLLPSPLKSAPPLAVSPHFASMPLLLSPPLPFLSRSEIPMPSAPLSQPPPTLLPPPLASALSFAFRPPFYSRRRSSLLISNLRRHLLSLLHSHPSRHFSLLPSYFFPTAAPVPAAAAAVVTTGPRPDLGYTVVNAVMEKEDGPGCRCVHTLTVVPAVEEEGSPDYIGLRLILFGGATALEGERGFEVLVLERDMSAIRWEGRYRGPIQLQSNTLAALEAIFAAAADEVMDAGCITGDHVSGIVDGASGSC